MKRNIESNIVMCGKFHLNSYMFLVDFSWKCCLMNLGFAVVDIAASVYCDTRSIVKCPRTARFGASAAAGDAPVELRRYFRHAAATIGVDLIFLYGGLREISWAL